VISRPSPPDDDALYEALFPSTLVRPDGHRFYETVTLNPTTADRRALAEEALKRTQRPRRLLTLVCRSEHAAAQVFGSADGPVYVARLRVRVANRQTVTLSLVDLLEEPTSWWEQSNRLPLACAQCRSSRVIEPLSLEQLKGALRSPPHGRRLRVDTG